MQKRLEDLTTGDLSPEVRRALKRQQKPNLVNAYAELKANARPFGGIEQARGRNSWLARTNLEARGADGREIPVHLLGDGFATFDCKPEGGSHENPAAYTERRMAEALLQFGGDRRAFSEFLRNLRRWMGRNATPAEIFQAIGAGKAWRDVLPKKGAQVAQETFLNLAPANPNPLPLPAWANPAPVGRDVVPGLRDKVAQAPREVPDGEWIGGRFIRYAKGR